MKSRLEKHIRDQLVAGAPVFQTQLHRRTAFSALHNAGGGLRDLDPGDASTGSEAAIANAQLFAGEVIDLLEEDRRAKAS